LQSKTQKALQVDTAGKFAVFNKLFARRLMCCDHWPIRKILRYFFSMQHDFYVNSFSFVSFC